MRASNSSESSARLLEEFRSARIARSIVERIRRHAEPATLMEVCGTHTVALLRSGVRAALPENITLVSGPGCPVCVTPREIVEEAIGLACRSRTVLFSFGDMMRVPGSKGSLESARADRGARVKLMYSPLEALEYARGNRDEDVVLLGVGFETTIPLFASVLKRARRARLDNLFLLPAFKLIPPALEALSRSGDCGVDGFILPGHVSAIIGEGPYRFLAEDYRIPGVITGFEPVDMLEGVLMLMEMVARTEARLLNQYGRFVPPEGNPKARALISEVFVPCEARWRGLGDIERSGLELREEFASFDARRLVQFDIARAEEPQGCRCAEVITGKARPEECPLFRSRCSPERPVGPCMVSSEGTCAAYFKYGERASGRARVRREAR